MADRPYLQFWTSVAVRGPCLLASTLEWMMDVLAAYVEWMD